MDQRKRPFSHAEVDDKLRFLPGLVDYITVAAEASLASVLAAYCFFDSPLGLISFIPLGALNLRRYLIVRGEKRQENIRQEFREILLSVASSIRTGYSVENAFCDAKDVLKNMYGDRSILYGDMVEMDRQIKMHIPVEKAFAGIVRKYPIDEMCALPILDEIESFGEIFLHTKRLGGGYALYLKDTADRLEERINLKSELNAMIAQKKLELTIMSVMPVAILFYMRLTGGSFLEPLYHNVFGVTLMAVCLVIYAGSVMLGRHMIKKVMDEL